MEYIAITFRSRSHTMRAYETLKRFSVASSIINTPKEAGVGCGLSVRIPTERFSFCKKVVFRLNLNSFAGFFLVKQVANKRIVKSI